MIGGSPHLVVLDSDVWHFFLSMQWFLFYRRVDSPGFGGNRFLGGCRVCACTHLVLVVWCVQARHPTESIEREQWSKREKKGIEHKLDAFGDSGLEIEQNFANPKFGCLPYSFFSLISTALTSSTCPTFDNRIVSRETVSSSEPKLR